ncbi:MAG: protein-disulfide reductase DsbD [Methylophilales bacterium]|nr:protein-disulfide reductase DsbD [Methylophilales bacterium]
MKKLLLLAYLLPSLAFAGLLPERSSSADLGSVFSASSDEAFLSPDEAFKLNVQSLDAQTLIASFTVAPGHYLYQKRISFKLGEGTKSSISAVELPKGEIKDDPNFGKSEVYHHPFEVTIRLQHIGATPQKITLNAGFQGCSEKGLCYAPMKKTFELELPATTTKLASTPSENDHIQNLLGSHKLWLITLGFFGFGLLLAFTPCVFPMIPILSGIIVGYGEHPSRAHAFHLSLAYTLGMAVAYALAGVAAGLSGHLISNTLQNPWALGFGALLFVVLALSMFDLYELRLPSAFESRIAEATNHIKGGRFISVFAMGALSALLVSPCVAAPLAGALLFIANTHDVVLGGVALFAMALGMGMPLLAVGLSHSMLPKAGHWMTVVRNLFGIMMLGMAIWLVSPVIPVAAQMGLWGALAIGTAIFLSALDPLPAEAGNGPRLGKAIGIVALILGASLILGALAGNRNPLQPLSGIFSNSKADSKVESGLPFKRIKNVADLDAAVLAAKGHYVMLDFYADWCASCKEYERTTFSDPRIRKALKDVSLLQADVTDNTAEDKALLARFGLFGPPGILFFDREGVEIVPAKVVGYQPAELFMASLNRVFLSKDGQCPNPVEC